MLEWFAKTTRQLDRLIIWATAVAGSVGAMSWLATKLSIFGKLPWPEAIFLGIAATLVICLAVAGVGALRRAYRPLPALHARIDNLGEAVDDTLGPLVADLEKLDGLVHTAIRLEGERFDKIEKAHGLLDAKVSRMIDDYQRMLAFKTEAEEELAALKGQTEQARESFAALQNRDAMHKVALRMEEWAKELYDPLRRGEVYDDERWQQWESTFGTWEAMLLVWIQNAQWYAYKVKDRINTVDHSKFGGDWTVSDDQFPPNYPRSLAVHHFKKFRIMNMQWEEVRKEADKGVDLVAYVGMSPREMQRRPRND
ncbi:MAG TPA: hypothetical protein VFP12_01780 [Allosphingosinicella sp.]|nr:hypothetical protein [Allosphingosinicella sp.]